MDGISSMPEIPPKGTPMYGEDVLSWIAPEYPNHAKSERWYMLAGISVVSLIAYGLITAEYSMAIAFALLAAVYHMVHNHPPRDITVRITTLGIVIDENFTQFSDFSSFWIIFNASSLRKLYLRRRQKFAPDIALELSDQDPLAIRQALESHISEIVGKTEHITDKITRWLNL